MNLAILGTCRFPGRRNFSNPSCWGYSSEFLHVSTPYVQENWPSHGWDSPCSNSLSTNIHTTSSRRYEDTLRAQYKSFRTCIGIATWEAPCYAAPAPLIVQIGVLLSL